MGLMLAFTLPASTAEPETRQERQARLATALCYEADFGIDLGLWTSSIPHDAIFDNPIFRQDELVHVVKTERRNLQGNCI